MLPCVEEKITLIIKLAQNQEDTEINKLSAQTKLGYLIILMGYHPLKSWI